MNRDINTILRFIPRHLYALELRCLDSTLIRVNFKSINNRFILPATSILCSTFFFSFKGGVGTPRHLTNLFVVLLKASKQLTSECGAMSIRHDA